MKSSWLWLVVGAVALLYLLRAPEELPPYWWNGTGEQWRIWSAATPEQQRLALAGAANLTATPLPP